MVFFLGSCFGFLLIFYLFSLSGDHVHVHVQYRMYDGVFFFSSTYCAGFGVVVFFLSSFFNFINCTAAVKGAPPRAARRCVHPPFPRLQCADWFGRTVSFSVVFGWFSCDIPTAVT